MELIAALTATQLVGAIIASVLSIILLAIQIRRTRK